MTNSHASEDEVQQTVIKSIEAVFKNKGLTPPTLGPETAFDRSLGLDSLDFAEVVIRLEEQFDKDPFAQGSVWQIRTIGDLAALYR